MGSGDLHIPKTFSAKLNFALKVLPMPPAGGQHQTHQKNHTTPNSHRPSQNHSARCPCKGRCSGNGLLVFVDGLAENVEVEEDAGVFCAWYLVSHADVARFPPKHLRPQPLQFLNQCPSVLHRDITRGQNPVNQQTQLRLLKAPLPQKVALLVLLKRRNIVVGLDEQIDVTGNGLALALHLIVAPDVVDNIPLGQNVVIVRIIFQNLQNASRNKE